MVCLFIYMPFGHWRFKHNPLCMDSLSQVTGESASGHVTDPSQEASGHATDSSQEDLMRADTGDWSYSSLFAYVAENTKQRDFDLLLPLPTVYTDLLLICSPVIVFQGPV